VAARFVHDGVETLDRQVLEIEALVPEASSCLTDSRRACT
jgi:hypothetical protein